MTHQVDDPSPSRSMQRRSTLCTPETAAQTAEVQRRSKSGHDIPPTSQPMQQLGPSASSPPSSGRSSVRAWLEEVAATAATVTATTTTTTEEQQKHRTVFWAALEGLQHARSNGELRMPLYPSALLLQDADADRPLRVTVDARLKPNRAEAAWYSPEPASTSPSEADAFTLGALLFEVRVGPTPVVCRRRVARERVERALPRLMEGSTSSHGGSWSA